MLRVIANFFRKIFGLKDKYEEFVSKGNVVVQLKAPFKLSKAEEKIMEKELQSEKIKEIFYNKAKGYGLGTAKYECDKEYIIPPTDA